MARHMKHRQQSASQGVIEGLMKEVNTENGHSDGRDITLRANWTTMIKLKQPVAQFEARRHSASHTDAVNIQEAFYIHKSKFNMAVCFCNRLVINCGGRVELLRLQNFSCSLVDGEGH